jgi:hypothetical protein
MTLSLGCRKHRLGLDELGAARGKEPGLPHLTTQPNNGSKVGARDRIADLNSNRALALARNR